jgi:Putative Ig domain
MKKIIVLLPFVAFGSVAQASTAYGTLSNFDAVNDTGQTCHGFEIEIDDIHSRDISYTYNHNHFGAPKIREDSSDPLHPKVYIRYEDSTKSSAFTNPAAPGAISPTNGHQCTNPAVNLGCEHFGVGYRANPTAHKYNWLIKNANGQIVLGPVVDVGNPTWKYNPPVVRPNPDPNLPPIVDFPAQVVAAIPAPVVPIPVAKKYGNPSWVKVIKTKTHNANPLELEDLIGNDKDNDGFADWTNREPDEVESEWKLLQTNTEKPDKELLEGKADELPNGNEVVTRRYEFYAYVAGARSINGEDGEAMCEDVGPDNIHGVGSVTVTDSAGNDYEFDCSTAAVVGDYQGAQMGEFNPVAKFGLIDTVQNGRVGELYPERTIPDGGNTPYLASVSAGALPNGLLLQSSSGILFGAPTKIGTYSFTVTVQDANEASLSKAYSIHVTGPGDVDGDNDIDLADLAVIKSKYGQAVAAKDPTDLNGDLKVNILDYRRAASLCTRAGCAN